MELLIADATVAGLKGDPAVWQAALRTELSTFDENVRLEESDIGPGADWPMILAIFSAIGSAFILGEKIEKNLDAWIRLAGRFRKLISRLQERFTLKRIDPFGGSLLALEHIGQEETAIRSIEPVALAVIPISPFPRRGHRGSRPGRSGGIPAVEREAAPREGES